MNVKNDDSKENVINVTFIIGNGFDLNLGLKTSYKDFVEVYKTPQKEDSEEILLMKELLKEDDYNWCDLEEKLGEYTNSFDDGIKFSNAHNDIGAKLCEYLKREQSKAEKFFQSDDRLCIYFMSSIETAINNYVNEIYKNVESMKNKRIIINFIVFNYTNIIDKIIDRINNNKQLLEKKYDNYDFGKIVHCHGFLGDQICFGVDNETQIENKKIFNDISVRYKQELIKPEYNKIIKHNFDKHAKEMINQSNIIIAYGCSFGATDLTWINEISRWLGKTNTMGGSDYSLRNFIFKDKGIRKFICYSNNQPKNNFFKTLKMVYEDSIKEKFTFADDTWVDIVYGNMFLSIKELI